MFEIKSGLPIPERRNGKHSIYNFSGMKVGDYFEAPDDMGRDKGGASKRQKSIACSARGFSVRHTGEKWKFITAVDREAGLVRCWRVE